MITNAGLNLRRDVLRGTVTDGQVKYLAWGDDDTAPTAADVKLGNETGRKAVTSYATGDTGILDIIIYLSQSDAVGTIKEIGLFAGATATGTKDSGILVSRILYNKTKTNLEAINIDYKDKEEAA